MSSMVAGPWYKTGEYRTVPWRWGLMRAEQQERRDYRWKGDDEVTGYNLRWVAYVPTRQEAENLNYGFYSLMAADSVLRRFITWWRHD